MIFKISHIYLSLNGNVYVGKNTVRTIGMGQRGQIPEVRKVGDNRRTDIYITRLIPGLRYLVYKCEINIITISSGKLVTDIQTYKQSQVSLLWLMVGIRRAKQCT